MTYQDHPVLNRVRKLPALQRLAHWVNERESVNQRRLAGETAPWTNDPIIGTYRFCNVHREDDRVTRWIKGNWRDPNADSPHMWHAMIIARTINWPDTLEAGGWPEPWSRKRTGFIKRTTARKAEGHKTFTAAYIVSTNGADSDKLSYVLDLFDQSWNCDEPPLPTDTLAIAHAKLMEIRGLGNFMAAQVIADLKHTPYLNAASDWNDWCAPGPGSLRGLARIKYDYTGDDRPEGRVINRREFVQELTFLRQRLAKYTDIYTCLQDLQNALCEWDKYERALWGQGKLRSTYRTHGEI